MKTPLNKIALAAALTASFGMSAAWAEPGATDTKPMASDATAATTDDMEDMMEDRQDAQEQLAEAKEQFQKMRQDPELAALMDQSKGLFLVPDYAQAAFLVGAEGGEGVMMQRTETGWSGPAFYNIGAITGGLQAGASAGQIALLLMSDKAVDEFMQQNNFALGADAGITIIDYSARAEGSAGDGDIVIWADTEGLFADAALKVQDIHYDDSETDAYYGQNVEPHRVSAAQATESAGSMGSAGSP